MALRAFAAKPKFFDAILTDLTMPGLTGIQLAERARAIRPDIPFAIMTGNVAALQGYAGKCMSKPMQLGELSDCLNELFTAQKATTTS